MELRCQRLPFSHARVRNAVSTQRSSHSFLCQKGRGLYVRLLVTSCANAAYDHVREHGMLHVRVWCASVPIRMRNP